MMYSGVFSDYEDKSISVSDFESTDTHKGIFEIIYSHGLKVPMMTGQNATDYFNGRFSDRWYPDFYKIRRSDVTVKEIMDFIKKYEHDRCTVNMNRFILQTPVDMLEEISHYAIDGLNWIGTEWNRK